MIIAGSVGVQIILFNMEPGGVNMRKNILLIIFLVSVVVFPSLTVAIKTSDDGSKRATAELGSEFDVIASCIECH